MAAIHRCGQHPRLPRRSACSTSHICQQLATTESGRVHTRQPCRSGRNVILAALGEGFLAGGFALGGLVLGAVLTWLSDRRKFKREDKNRWIVDLSLDPPIGCW